MLPDVETAITYVIVPLTLSIAQKSSHMSNMPPSLTSNACNMVGSNDILHATAGLEILSAGVMLIFKVKISPTPTVFSIGETAILFTPSPASSPGKTDKRKIAITIPAVILTFIIITTVMDNAI